MSPAIVRASAGRTIDGIAVQEAKDVGRQPLSSKEIDKVQRGDIRKLPGAYETAAAV